jgi:hypothetical protein
VIIGNVSRASYQPSRNRFAPCRAFMEPAVDQPVETERELLVRIPAAKESDPQQDCRGAKLCCQLQIIVKEGLLIFLFN